MDGAEGRTAAVITKAAEALLLIQNVDGGWGARPRRTSTTEATSFAAMALGALDDSRARESTARALGWLTRQQNEDGSWPVSPAVAGGSWSTSLAILALSVLGAETGRAARGAAWLIRQESRSPGWLLALLYRLAPGAVLTRQDPGIKSWPWAASTTGFVEPTAYALLALKKLLAWNNRDAVEQRVREGERMIYDRMCEGGGWNYGNSRVYDVPLSPFPDVTGLALVALQDHLESAPNQKSLRALHEMLGRVDSGLALGWGALCLDLYGADTGECRRRLREAYMRTNFFDDTKSLALASLALGDGARIFRL